MELATRKAASPGAVEQRTDIEFNARNVIMKTRASFAHPIQTGRCDEPDCAQSRVQRGRHAFRGR